MSYDKIMLINLAIYNYIDNYEDKLGVSCHSIKERTIKYAYILHVTSPGLVLTRKLTLNRVHDVTIFAECILRKWFVHN